MEKRARWTARLTGVAAIAATGVLLVTVTEPVGAAPSEDVDATVDRLANEADSLSDSAKKARVDMYDHSMGSQLKKVKLQSSRDTVRQAEQTAWQARFAGRDVEKAVSKRLSRAIWRESGRHGKVSDSVSVVVKSVDWDKLQTRADTKSTIQTVLKKVEKKLADKHTPKPPKLPKPPSKGNGPTGDGPKKGIDVSGHQQNVNWKSHWNQGKRFAYVKATEGTGYKNPYFSQQYSGSADVGMKRGSYHFALPNRSSGAAQANFFANNGGGWSRDGNTLPGALDMEYNPYGDTCYGMSQASLRSWIKDFHDTYKARTGRYPVIYTGASWWNQCVGGGHGLQNTAPLWTARYGPSVGALPAGWDAHTFWQYSDRPIDQNEFNGSTARLTLLANG